MNTRARARMDLPLLNVATCALACVIGVIGCSAPSAPVEASIRGRFLFHGEVPAPQPLTVNMDVKCCGDRPLLSEDLVVADDRGLANVVVYIRDKTIPAPKQKNIEPVRISTTGCRYEPHVILVQTGQEVVFETGHCESYNPNIATVKNAPLGMLVPAKHSLSCRFLSPESIPSQLTCNIHPWMKAWVLIRSNPYASVSAPNGEFEIRSVPHGAWELQFWHEKLGYLEEMSIDGVVRKLPKGRMSVEVGPRGVDFGTIALEGPPATRQAEPSVGADSR